MKRIIIFTLVVISTSIVFISTVRAQELSPETAGSTTQVQTSLGISPAILEAVLDQDTPTEKYIELTNISNLPQPVKTLKQSFTPREKLELSEQDLKVYDSSSWITISDQDTDFIIQPHETKRVKITIQQPKDASPGGHYATIIFQPLIPQELVSQESIFIYARVAVLVFLQTKGDIVQNLEYQKTDYQKFSDQGNQNFIVSIKNNGNTHLLPTGKINVYDDFTNQVIASEDLKSSVILPGTTKDFQIEVNLNRFIGRYSVETEMKYGTDSHLLKSNREVFIIFPITTILFLILPISVLLFFGLKHRDRLKASFAALTEKPVSIPNNTPKPKIEKTKNQHRKYSIEYKTNIKKE